MSDQLLPCPFCKSPANKSKGSYFDKGAYCSNVKGCRIGGIIFHSEKEWNTRPDSKPYKHEDFKEWWENSFVRISSSCREHTALEAWNTARERKE